MYALGGPGNPRVLLRLSLFEECLMIELEVVWLDPLPCEAGVFLANRTISIGLWYRLTIQETMYYVVSYLKKGLRICPNTGHRKLMYCKPSSWPGTPPVHASVHLGRASLLEAVPESVVIWLELHPSEHLVSSRRAWIVGCRECLCCAEVDETLHN